MIKNFNIKSIDDVEIKDKKVLLRVDFNVTRNDDLSISDDARIVQALPTIKYLLKNNNKLILISHLGQPEKKDSNYSLKHVANRLRLYLPKCKVRLIDDFLSSSFASQDTNEILILENIRFYPEEKDNNQQFAKKLAGLAEVYVNDAFGVCHRKDASVVSVPQYIPSYAGLLLKKEIEAISTILDNPQKPFVAIVGGAKIKTKINLLEKIMDIADYILVGGALANNFLLAYGLEMGTSKVEIDEVDVAKKILSLASKKNVTFVLPKDVIVTDLKKNNSESKMVKVNEIPKHLAAVDIGPQTEAEFGTYIANAKTIVWNGPVGYCDNKRFCLGTEFIYYSITKNQTAFSIVGGGDTLAAISHEEYLGKISHLSTGGGAMLEFIEKGTLPGIEALRNNS
ncbi:MAG TPA: phosphoglycerate kinase [Candidatus Nitrosocosmicus sp.]|nr:phosphoglycerate kinase [Candidatus Nitrosocosmicus sp.]